MNFKGEFLDSLLGLVSPKRQRKVPRTAPRSPAFSGSNPYYSMQAGSNPQPPGVENRGNFPRLLADLHCGPTCYIASGDIQGNWVACSRLREHVSASPEAGALHAHVRVSMAPKEDPNRGGDRRGVSKFSRCSPPLMTTQTFPPKVPSCNLGRIGKMRSIGYNLLYLMALRCQDRRFSH